MAGFTEAELAVLAQLSYYDVPYPDVAKESLGTFLEDKRGDLESSLGPGYQDTIQGLIDKCSNGDYKIVKSVNEKHGSGFAAIAIQDPDNNVTVACRGTEGFNVIGSDDSRRDVYTDAQIGTRLETNQQQSMERFMDELQDDGYNGYYFTGHSLGGNLAMHGAIQLNDSSQVLGVTTFNAPGFNAAYLTHNKFKIDKISGRMVAYQNQYDYVSSVFQTPGKIVIVESVYSEGDFGFSHHSISGFRIDSSGHFVGTDGKGIRTVIVDAATDGLINIVWGVKLVFGLITGNPAVPLESVRDYSPEAKEMLCNAARETEEEQWWQVTRWDCWYRVDQFFGTLEWDLYTGNVDSYYRKLIDINNASVKDIERIFENIYSVDDSYGAKIQNQTSILRSEVLSKLRAITAAINPAG